MLLPGLKSRHGISSLVIFAATQPTELNWSDRIYETITALSGLSNAFYVHIPAKQSKLSRSDFLANGDPSASII